MGTHFFDEESTESLVEARSLEREEARNGDGAPFTIWRLSSPTLAALRGANCLVGEDGEATLRDDAQLTEANLGVPNSIYGILLARLDRLPDTARLALKVASVMGRSFSLTLLQHVRLLEAHRAELAESLRLALLRDFVRIEASAEPGGDTGTESGTEAGIEAGDGTGDGLHLSIFAQSQSHSDRYYFRHNLICDVCYKPLLDTPPPHLH